MRGTNSFWNNSDREMAGEDETYNTERLLIEELFSTLKETMKQILLYAQASMPESQFIAFRKLVLDAFGGKGLHAKLRILISKAMERAGAEKQIESRKES
jgi:hypothetical protein